MSKPLSGHFNGTMGFRNTKNLIVPKQIQNAIIKLKKDKTQIEEHPTKYKQLGSKKIKEFNEKIEKRSLSRDEYKRMRFNERLRKRRQAAIDAFWAIERNSIEHNLPTTRKWDSQQRADILRGRRPKYRGATMQSHHTYSVAKYPHLANQPDLIYPVTRKEHIYGWHGGNTRNSLPGRPIKYIVEF